MKVVIQAKDNPKTGKGKFVSRLIPALRKLGVEVATDITQKADIALHIGRVHYKSKAKKNIIRLGPAHVNTDQNYRKLNREKWQSVKQCDAIVYQSQYSRKVCRKFIGKHNVPDTIILNGADPEFYENLTPYDSPYEYNFLASTRKWLPQKRLNDIIKAFVTAEIKDSCLWVCGNVLEHKKLTQGVEYLDMVDDITLGRLYNLCHAMIHITYLDAMPNNVVEALVAGCRVIMTDQGGMKELIYASVWDMTEEERKLWQPNCILPDKKYNFQPINLSKPPKMNVEALADQMVTMTKTPQWGFNPKHLYINNIATQYVKFFKVALGE